MMFQAPTTERRARSRLIAAERHLPRYFFNVHDGHDIVDTEGTELADCQTARREAVQFACGVLKDTCDTLKFGEEWRMEVTDERGLILFELDFCLTEAAAVRSSASD